MTSETIRTPVTELLDRQGISYRVLPHERPAFTCKEAAYERGVPLREMVKCLVFADKASGRAYMACVPADKRVAMSKLKKAVNVKSFRTMTSEEIKQATGYEQGAIPPIALPNSVYVVADLALLKRPKVNLSSGTPTAGIELSTWDFRKVFKGRFAEIAE